MLVSPPEEDLVLTLSEIPASNSNIPSELVGKWASPGASVSNVYEIRADGSYSSGSSGALSTVIVGSCRVDTQQDGYVNVSADQITFVPQRASFAAFTCSGEQLDSGAGSTNPYTCTWAVSADQNTLAMMCHLQSGNINTVVPYTLTRE